MKLNDTQVQELNALLKKSKLDLPFNKRIVERHTGVYSWLQKNIAERNTDKLSSRLKELLDLN